MSLQKFNTLKRVLKLVYTTTPVAAIIRDVLFISSVVLEMTLINIGGHFIDATGEILISLRQFTFYEFFLSDSFFYLMLGAGLWMIINSFGAFRDYLSDHIKKYVRYAMETEYFEKVAKSNLEDVEKKEFRDLLSFVNSYSFDSVFDSYKLFSDFIRDVFRVVSSLVILFQSIGFLGLVILLLPLPETLAGNYHRKKIKKYRDTEVERVKWLDYVVNLMTRIQYFPELRVDGTFTKLRSQYGKSSFELLSNLDEKDKHYYIDTNLFSTTGKVTNILVVIYLIAISIAKRFSIGKFKALYDYINTAYDSSYQAFNKLFQLSNKLDYSEKYFEYSDFQGFGDISSGNVVLKRGTPKIELKDLDFKYPDGSENVIKDINLLLEPGEKVMIIGKDGSGKSSLVKALCGLYKINDGDYLIDNVSIKDLHRGQLKKKISVLFQDFINYNMTLRDNITLSKEEKVFKKELYNKALKISGVDRMMKIFKIEENQMLGKYLGGGVDISPGFWQRIALARIIYRDRAILLLDEPFTHIDDDEEEKILKQILKYGKEKTIIYISREDRNSKYFERVYSLDNGRLTQTK